MAPLHQKHLAPGWSKLLVLLGRNLPNDLGEGVMALWSNPLTSQPEQSGGVSLIPSRTPILERHDKGSLTRLGLLFFYYPSAWRCKTQLHLHLQMKTEFLAPLLEASAFH